jgi:hypothetical protein
MPSPKQAANYDMTGYKRVPEQAVNKPSMTAHPPTSLRNPTMLASMPLMASTADAFQRQFYGGENVPTYRTLPAGSGGNRR